jgi:hypothetical protein
MTAKFKVGDTIRHEATATDFTVVEAEGKDNHVVVTWFEGGRVRSMAFPAEAFKLVETPKPS